MTRRGKELSGDAAQPMLDLQHRWVEALVKADTAALDTILVDSSRVASKVRSAREAATA